MSREEFLQNLRVARSLPLPPQVQADSRAIDPQQVQTGIAGKDLWLTPKWVKGFNVADFSDLGLQGQEEAQAAVKAFSDVAERVRLTGEPDSRRSRRGRAPRLRG